MESTARVVINLVHPDAILPFKSLDAKFGYYLTIVKEHKKMTDDITVYDTGITASVEDGYGLEIIPNSSLINSGYDLENKPGIIDPGYTGHIFVALKKVNPYSPEIKLPFTCCYLVVRKI